MKTANPIIRKYNDSDKIKISSLYHAFHQGLSRESPQYFNRMWEWQFNTNPAVNDIPPDRIILEWDNKFIGCIAAFPIWLKLDEEIVTAFPSIFFMVNPKFPGRGIILAKHHLDSPGIRIVLSATETAAKLFRALGAVTISEKSFTGVKLYSTRGFLNKGLILKLISKILDLFLHIFSLIFFHVSNGLQIKEIKEFGDEFDFFWRDVSKEYKNIFIRDKKYLNWRLFQVPFEKVRVFAAYDKDNQLKGYIATTIQFKKSVRCGKIVDYLVHADGTNVMDALINFALKDLMHNGVERVYSELYTGKFKKAFLKNGFLFFKRKKPNRIWIKDNRKLSKPEDLQNMRNWFYTGSEGDGSNVL